MIYIYNNTNNIITTESWIDTIPPKVIIYFNDIEVGEFNNISTSPTYLRISVPGSVLTSLKLENMEYTMKIYKDYSLFKMELITVQSGNDLSIVSPIKQTTLKMKEK